MVGQGPVGQAIGVAGRDIQRIQDAQTVLQIADAGRQGGADGRRQITAGAPEAVAPSLLAMGQLRTLQGLLHRLMAGEAGPFMVAGGDGWQPTSTSIQLITLMRGRTTTSRSSIGSARVRQRRPEPGGGPWCRGKGLDSYAPLGPVLVSAAELPDPPMTCCLAS